MVRCLHDHYERNHPTKKIKPKTKIPYLTYDLLHLVRKKNCQYNHAKRVGTARAWFKYTKIQNQVTSALRSTKKIYFHQLADNIHSPRDFWSQYHKLNPKHSRTPANLHHQGQNANTPTEKANLFNNFFTSCFTRSEPQSDVSSPPTHLAQLYPVLPARITKFTSYFPHIKSTLRQDQTEFPV